MEVSVDVVLLLQCRAVDGGSPGLFGPVWPRLWHGEGKHGTGRVLDCKKNMGVISILALTTKDCCRSLDSIPASA
jgi:hypothetical protein